MKKVLTMMLLAVALVVTACKPTPEKIAEKISNNETLSEKDYEAAIGYAENLLTIMNDSIEKNKGDFNALIRSLKNINEAYPESNIIVSKLMTTDPSTLDENTRKLYDKFIKNVETMTDAVVNEGPISRIDYSQETETETEIAPAQKLDSLNTATPPTGAQPVKAQ